MTGTQLRIWNILTFRGRGILESMVVTLCAGDEFVLSRIRMQHVVLRAEKQISELPFVLFLGFKICLYLIEYSFPPLAWKFRRFSRLPLESRMAYLETWEGSSLALKRNIFKLVKALCICNIFSEHKLLAAIGYEESLVKRMQSRRF
ncbi:MAG: hypothetical protein ACXVBW_13510 [Bdellovibrionota bacterium]